MEEAAQFKSSDTIVDPPSPVRRHVKWKMTRTKKSGQITFEATKEITDRIVSDSHLLVVIFYNNCWMSKPNIFNILTTRFLRRAGLTEKLCRPWTSRFIDCCHWVTRAPWSCPCYRSRCHDQTLIWTGFKGLPHLFVHGSRRPREVDTKD